MGCTIGDAGNIFEASKGVASHIESLGVGSVLLFFQFKSNLPGKAREIVLPNFAFDDLSGGDSWQYSEKRFDEESGLLAFGLRYYDPKIGRWISQDPAEFEDGPNRYAYVHNNPLILFDRYGLFSEFGYNGLDWYSPSPSLDYRTFDILTPMYENRWSLSTGIAHGGFDHLYDQLECWESCCYGIGAGMMEFDHDEYQYITATFGYQQQSRSEFFDASIQNLFSIDANDTVYQQTRSTTKLGLEVATIGAAGYSLAKAGVKAGSVAYRSINSVKKATPFQRSLPAATKPLDLVGLGETTATFKRSAITTRPYTKSNFRLGQQMHKSYKLGVPGEKEYLLPSGKRIDFLDPINGIIYELKPYNPRSMRQGLKQLELYKNELEQLPRWENIEWKTVLETY